jgi:hypothetical protein
MNSLTGLRVALLLTVWATTWPTAAAAQTFSVLPSPLSLGDVMRGDLAQNDELHKMFKVNRLLIASTPTQCPPSVGHSQRGPVKELTHQTECLLRDGDEHLA